MKDIIIVGSGGLAKEVYAIIKSNNKNDASWNVIGFISKSKKGMEIIDGLKVIGDDNYVLNYDKKINIIIAVADTSIRQSLVKKLNLLKNISFPNIIHKSIFIDFDNVEIGYGNVLFPNTIVAPHVKIGNFNILNFSTFLGHDSIVKNFCTINPNATIPGSVVINNYCTVGANATIHQGIHISEKSIIGIGSVLTRASKADSTYFGNPARKIK